MKVEWALGAELDYIWWYTDVGRRVKTSTYFHMVRGKAGTLSHCSRCDRDGEAQQDNTLAKWSKVTAPVTRCIDMHPSSDALRRAKHHIWRDLLKMRRLTLSWEHIRHTQMEGCSTEYLTSSLGRCQGCERQRPRNCHRLVVAKETWQLSQDWVLHEEKSIRGRAGNIQIKSAE